MRKLLSREIIEVTKIHPNSKPKRVEDFKSQLLTNQINNLKQVESDSDVDQVGIVLNRSRVRIPVMNKSMIR